MILTIFVEQDMSCVIQSSRVRCVNFPCLYKNMWEPTIVLYSVDFSLILLLFDVFESMDMIKALFLFECNYLAK
jgi:hypothetical protein